MLRRSAWRREWQWYCSLPVFEVLQVLQAGVWPRGARVGRRLVSQRVRTRPNSCGPNVRFAWLVIGVGVAGGGVVDNVARKRDGDVTVGSAVLLSMRQMVVRGLSSFLPYSSWGRAE